MPSARPPLDLKRPLVAAKRFRFAGEWYDKGDPFNPKGFSDRLVRRQYEARVIRHHVPGEFDQEDDEDGELDYGRLVKMEGPSGGRYTITAPWLDEPETIRGKKPADDRYAQVVAEGPPEGWAMELLSKEALAQVNADDKANAGPSKPVEVGKVENAKGTGTADTEQPGNGKPVQSAGTDAGKPEHGKPIGP